MFRHDVRRFAIWLFNHLFTMEFRGVEQVPLTGGCLLATNHLSRLDTPFLFIGIDRDDLNALVTDKYRLNPLFAAFVKVTGSIWINRDIADHTAIRAGVAHIRAGGMLGLSPEGTRSQSGEMIEAKQGVALLAEKAQVPIIPVGVWGTETAMRSMRRFRKAHLIANFGAPFTVPALERENRNAQLQRNTEEIMCRIAALLPPVYRGFYADHPRLQELLKN